MYPPQDAAPLAGGQPGQLIEHKLIPGFRTVILDVKPCDPDPAAGRPEEHSQYRVLDPAGHYDWVCAYDVRRA